MYGYRLQFLSSGSYPSVALRVNSVTFGFRAALCEWNPFVVVQRVGSPSWRQCRVGGVPPEEGGRAGVPV